jgi:hypothetical protein
MGPLQEEGEMVTLGLQIKPIFPGYEFFQDVTLVTLKCHILIIKSI